MSKARTVCTTALRTGSSDRPAATSSKKRVPNAVSAARRASGDAGPGSSTMSSAERQKA